MRNVNSVMDNITLLHNPVKSVTDNNSLSSAHRNMFQPNQVLLHGDPAGNYEQAPRTQNGLAVSVNTNPKPNNMLLQRCVLPVVKALVGIEKVFVDANVLLDSGSELNMSTKLFKRIGAKGIPVRVNITGVGGGGGCYAKAGEKTRNHNQSPKWCRNYNRMYSAR